MRWIALLVAIVWTSCGAPSAQAPSPSASGTASATAGAGASAGSSGAASGSPGPSSSPASSASSPGGSASPTSSAPSGASPSGSLPPTPTPVPSGPFAGYIFVPSATGSPPQDFTRYGATVVDAASGDPVVGACVYTGPPAGCPLRGASQTDANGFFAVDLPTGSDFAFTVEHPSYKAIIQATLTRGVQGSLTMAPK